MGDEGSDDGVTDSPKKGNTLIQKILNLTRLFA